MSITFGQQRTEINKQAEEILKAQRASKKAGAQAIQPPVQVTTTESIRNRWPFLFVPSGMLMHYTTLTEVNLEEKFEIFIDSEMNKMIEFLSATNKDRKKKSILKKVKQAEEALGDESNVPAFGGCLLLLLQRFGEKKDALWMLIDEDIRESEIPEQVKLPNTPCLIIKGSTIFTEDDVYFTMDGHLLGTAAGLIEGIAMLFASYFVFNLDYAAEAQITLEFIQRIVADVNPPRGNKRPKRTAGGKASSKSIHHTLAQMNEKYDEYFAENSESEESNVIDNDLEDVD